MKKGTKRVLGGIALAAGAVGAAGAFLGRKDKVKRRRLDNPANVWARPGMTVTFRAEVMPGRERAERTARVRELLPSGRVTLFEVSGEHAQKEFESIQ